MDGSDEQSGSLNKGAFMGKNFGYYSFANGVVDLEPLSADWDLVFTKFIGYVPSAYPVAGVLQNKDVPAPRSMACPPIRPTGPPRPSTA